MESPFELDGSLPAPNRTQAAQEGCDRLFWDELGEQASYSGRSRSTGSISICRLRIDRPSDCVRPWTYLVPRPGGLEVVRPYGMQCRIVLIVGGCQLHFSGLWGARFHQLIFRRQENIPQRDSYRKGEPKARWHGMDRPSITGFTPPTSSPLMTKVCCGCRHWLARCFF